MSVNKAGNITYMKSTFPIIVLLVLMAISTTGQTQDNNESSDIIIRSISPDSASSNDEITIFGESFGNYSENSFVLFNGVFTDSILEWTDSKIRLLIPSFAIPGSVKIINNTDTSNEYIYHFSDTSGIFTIVGYTPPSKFEFGMSFPSPMSVQTTIQFSIAETCKVKVVMYNVLDEHVATLFSGMLERGIYRTKKRIRSEDGEVLKSGIYIYKITTDTGFTASRKAMILK